MLRSSVLKMLVSAGGRAPESDSSWDSLITNMKPQVNYLQWCPVTLAGPWEWGDTIAACLGHGLL